MAGIVISEQGILKLLQGLKIHKAPGPDGIGPHVLKELSTTVGLMLTLIFQKYYDTGEVPTDWREANVAAIYKKGNKKEAVNYRPVSLTCIACKLLEHIVTGNIMQQAVWHSLSAPARVSQKALMWDPTAGICHQLVKQHAEW